MNTGYKCIKNNAMYLEWLSIKWLTKSSKSMVFAQNESGARL